MALELFGNRELIRASRVGFSLPAQDTLQVTVWDGPNLLFTRALRQPADFRCEAGRLIIRDRRMVGGPAASAWQSVTITLTMTDQYLLVQTEEIVAGLALIFPVAASSRVWYRFRRQPE